MKWQKSSYSKTRNAVIFLFLALCIFMFSLQAFAALPLCKSCGDEESCYDGNGFDPPSGYEYCEIDYMEFPPCTVWGWMNCS